jgi:hypothetical protein
MAEPADLSDYSVRELLLHAAPVGRGLRSEPLHISGWSFWATKGAAEVSLTPGLPAEPAKVTETKG